MRPLGSIAALVAAIRDDAATEADAINAGADAAVAQVMGDPSSCPAPPVGDGRLVPAARDRARIRVSQEDWLDARDAVTQREEWIQRVITLGAQQLRERLPAAETTAQLAALAREAIARLPAGSIVIVVSAADAPLLDRDWRALVSPSGDPDQVTITVAAIDGGCIARSADGRASFDNTYAARTERLQSRWRAELSEYYERMTSHIGVGDAEAES